MLRFVELALFLAPFVVFAAWRLLAGGGGPSRKLVVTATCVVVVVAGALYWLNREQAIAPGLRYVPAQLEDGHVVPGHAEPR